MLEAYQAFGDYETMMETVESLITTVAQKVLGTDVIKHERYGELALALDLVVESNLPEVRRRIEAVTEASTRDKLLAQVDCLVHESRQARGKLGSVSTTESACHLIQGFQNLKDAMVIASKQTPDMSQKHNLVIAHEEADKAFTRLVGFGSPKEINLNGPWKRAKYKDLVREKVSEKTDGKYTDWFALTPEERRRVAMEDLKLAGDIAKGYEDFEVTGAVFEKLVEPTLIQPTFVTHLPKELVPLAKLTPDDPTTVEVFECCINGQEISPGYTEQNDPIQQRATLEHQAGGEQQKLDEDFLVALEHGMPPAGGIGIGIDRLCMMLLGQESIRDVILFPQLKPKS